MKPISFLLGGRDIKANLQSQVRRTDLYGRTAKIILSPDGKQLKQGLLTQEGRLLEKTGYSGVIVDEKGSFIGSASHVCDGEPVEPKPASFKESRPLESASLDSLNEFAVEAVYPIEPETELKPGLYATTFNYVASVEPRDCLILIQDGAPGYLLAGSRLEFSPAGKNVVYNLFDEDEAEAEEEDADFDFGDSF